MPAPLRLPVEVYADRNSMRNAFGAISQFADSVADLGFNIRKGFEFTNIAEKIESETLKMAVGMGGASAQAADLRENVIDLGLSTGYGAGELLKLSTGLAGAGMKLADFGADTQKAMGGLTHHFSLTGEQIALTTKTLANFGGSIEATLGDAVAFQKGFKVPGLIEQLPGIVNNARASFLRFGKNVVGSTGDVIRATTTLSGVFVKAFGTTMSDAVKRAQESMGKFASAAHQDEDVFLGLSDNFSGLTTVLMESGIGLNRAMEITKKGVSGNLEGLLELAEVRDSFANNPFMSARFESQLRKELPADMYALMETTEKLQKTIGDKRAAEAMQKAWGVGGVDAFNDLSKTLGSTTLQAREFLESTLELGKAIIGRVGEMAGFKKILQGATETFREWAGGIRKFVNSEEFTDLLTKLAPYFEAAGKFAVKAGVAVGGFFTAIAGGFASVRIFTRGLWGLDRVFGPFSSKIPFLTKGIGALGSGLKAIGRAALTGVSGFMGITEAVTDMADVLGDPKATGWEKFEAIFRGGIKGFASFFNTALLGIPKMLLSHFFPDLEKSFNGGVSLLFEEIRKWFPADGKGLVEVLGKWLNTAGDWLLERFPGFGDKLGEAFGKVVVGLGKVVVGLGELVYDAIHAVLDDPDGRLQRGVGKILTAGVGFGIAFAQGFGEGMLSALGTSQAALGTRVAIIGHLLQDVWQDVWDGAKEYLASFLDNIPVLLLPSRGTIKDFGKFVLEVFGKIVDALPGSSVWGWPIKMGLAEGRESLEKLTSTAATTWHEIYADKAKANADSRELERSRARENRDETLRSLQKELAEQDKATADWRVGGDAQRRKWAQADRDFAAQQLKETTTALSPLMDSVEAAIAKASGLVEGVMGVKTEELSQAATSAASEIDASTAAHLGYDRALKETTTALSPFMDSVEAAIAKASGLVEGVMGVKTEELSQAATSAASEIDASTAAHLGYDRAMSPVSDLMIAPLGDIRKPKWSSTEDYRDRVDEYATSQNAAAAAPEAPWGADQVGGWYGGMAPVSGPAVGSMGSGGRTAAQVEAENLHSARVTAFEVDASIARDREPESNIGADLLAGGDAGADVSVRGAGGAGISALLSLWENRRAIGDVVTDLWIQQDALRDVVRQITGALTAPAVAEKAGTAPSQDIASQAMRESREATMDVMAAFTKAMQVGVRITGRLEADADGFTRGTTLEQRQNAGGH